MFTVKQENQITLKCVLVCKLRTIKLAKLLGSIRNLSGVRKFSAEPKTRSTRVTAFRLRRGPFLVLVGRSIGKESQQDPLCFIMT